MTRPTRRTSCGGSPSVIFNSRMTGHHLSTTQHNLNPPHSERISATLAGAICILPRTHPEVRKTRGEGEKGRRMAIKGITSRPSVAWAVPPSPARDICFVFCAFPDLGADRATTGRKGHKQHQKNCANLCTIVRQRKKARREEKPPLKDSFSCQWGLMDSRRKTAATSPLLNEPVAADTVSSSSSLPSSRISIPLRFKKAIATKKAVRLLPSLKI